MTDELAGEVQRTMVALDAMVAAGARIKIEGGGDGLPFAAQIRLGIGSVRERFYRTHGSTRDMAVLRLGALLREHGEISGDQPS